MDALLAAFSPEAWSRPVASLLNRAQLATDPKTSHDLLLSAWEAAIRLQVALSPPVARQELAEPSLGHWVKALPSSTEKKNSEALKALRNFWCEVAEIRRPKETSLLTLRQLVEYLPAYRNRIHGHGAPRSSDFYERARALLAAGLLEARRAGLLWADHERLIGIDAISEGQPGQRHARCLSLMGFAVTLANQNLPVTGSLAWAGHLYCESRGELTPLFPWLLWVPQGERSRVLFFNGSRNGLAYLDYETGETFKGDSLRDLRIHIEDPIHSPVSDSNPIASLTPTDAQGSEPRPDDSPPTKAQVVLRRQRARRLAPLAIATLPLLGVLAWANHQRPLAYEDWFFWDRRQGWGWSDRCWAYLHGGRLDDAHAACRRGLEIAPANSQARRALNYNLGLVAEKRGDARQAALWTSRALTIEWHPEIVASLERMCVATGAPPRTPGEARSRKVTSWEKPDGNTLRQAPTTASAAVDVFPGGTCAWADRASEPSSNPWVHLEVVTATKTVSGWMHQDILQPKR